MAPARPTLTARCRTRCVHCANSGLPLALAADVCLCSYTTHGHCGVLDSDRVANDATLPRLVDAALAYAEAGADIVAPSAMMDGQVAAIRAALDAGRHEETIILAYAAKQASALYGPFREAADSAPAFGDRRSYQLDPANRREALREMGLDAAEGADILMVKPALTNLDVLRERSRALRPATGRIPGERRGGDARGRCGGRAARPSGSHVGDPHGDRPGRCGHHRHVPGGRGRPAGWTRRDPDARTVRPRGATVPRPSFPGASAVPCAPGVPSVERHPSSSEAEARGSGTLTDAATWTSSDRSGRISWDTPTPPSPVRSASPSRRGDRSARHTQPRSAWRSASVRPCPPWHVSASPARGARRP